jgi:hypothetical protein
MLPPMATRRYQYISLLLGTKCARYPYPCRLPDKWGKAFSVAEGPRCVSASLPAVDQRSRQTLASNRYAEGTPRRHLLARQGTADKTDSEANLDPDGREMRCALPAVTEGGPERGLRTLRPFDVPYFSSSLISSSDGSCVAASQGDGLRAFLESKAAMPSVSLG